MRADLERFPELRAVDWSDILVPIALGPALYALGAVLDQRRPSLGTSG